MKLQNVTFDTWIRSHHHKAPEERWLRELYPWPVLAQVDCDLQKIGKIQTISHDDVDFNVTLKSIQAQSPRGTIRYRIRVDSEGLGWHSRSFSDDFDLIGTNDGKFVTLFHVKKEEPLERIARLFFGRKWSALSDESFRTLATSRFLAACVVGQVISDAFEGAALTHYPRTRLVGGSTPMFANGSELWIGYRFFSEDAYSWARRSRQCASKVVALYLADTKYQFKTDLPTNATVEPISYIDATRLNHRYADFIQILLRHLELSSHSLTLDEMAAVVKGRHHIVIRPISEADVNEALSALKLPCSTKEELRYQLAAAVLLNAWIESERSLLRPSKKKFYAFKEKVGHLVKWASYARLENVSIWRESTSAGLLAIIRIDDVDFSFHAIPDASLLPESRGTNLKWTGVRLKPIAPVLLEWAKKLCALK